ncbi:MAG TPA: hypothetical protein VE890_14010 [Thermoguttaceae bacterium]|nr:hypothetical protein [Thermoguttaceae bacterium]
MLRIAIIPVSMLLAYVFFTPVEPLQQPIDNELRVSMPVPESLVAPEGPVLLPANPAYASRSEGTFDAGPAVDQSAEEGGEHALADFAQVLTAMVNASSVTNEASQAESPAEEFFVQDMAIDATEEIAVEDVAAETLVADEPATEEQPAVEKPAEPSSVVDNTAETPESEEASESVAPELAAPEPKPVLSPAMAALRDRLRRTTATFYQRTLSNSQNTATDLMNYCMAFGCESQISQGTSSSAKKINGITYLCWNYPCDGFEPLTLNDGRIAARIGFGLQPHPSQLLAVLALSRVQPDYPARVGEHVGTVADLVEHEKLNCRADDNLSLKLIGLSYYVDEPTWTNRLGEEWSIERMVKEELDKPFPGAEASGTYRLMGLSCAVDQRVKREQPVDGQFARAQKFLEDYQQYALSLQNTDGSWGPQFLAARSTSRDATELLQSSGHVLQWLVMSLPEEQLQDARIIRSVEYLSRLLDSSRYRNGVRSLSAREIGSVMHALHALMVYDQRMDFDKYATTP